MLKEEAERKRKIATTTEVPTSSEEDDDERSRVPITRAPTTSTTRYGNTKLCIYRYFSDTKTFSFQ